jgi:uncharacterized protein YjbI with pentapeptide repeats
MTDKDNLVEKLLSGPEIWNQWRSLNPTSDRLNLKSVNLSGANLSGANLSEANLSQANLSGANLSGALLYAACLTQANLSRANLSSALLNGAMFTLADLSGANLRYADLRSLGFLLSDCLYELRRDEFDPIVMAMRRRNYLYTDLMMANLYQADLHSADLQGVNFHQAKLSQADLSGAEICRTSFYEADLSGADLRGANIAYINLRYAVITRQTKINDRWRRISLLQSKKVTKPYHWVGAQLKYADLDAVDLSGAQMPYADLRGTHLRYANLSGTNLDKARTEDTNWEGARYSCDTILPALSPRERQSLVWVDLPPKEPDNQFVLVNLENLKDSRKRTNVFRVSRKDQQKFREMLIDAFQAKCAITQCDVEGAMEAAHIFPYRGEETDCLWNGILLRLDLHRLFDSYLLTIDPLEYQVRLSPSLMNSCYREYADRSVCFPEEPISQNRKLALQWHNAQCSWWKNS